MPEIRVEIIHNHPCTMVGMCGALGIVDGEYTGGNDGDENK